jgi:hypothetical protein
MLKFENCVFLLAIFTLRTQVALASKTKFFFFRQSPYSIFSLFSKRFALNFLLVELLQIVQSKYN